jgi:hypothetical protein
LNWRKPVATDVIPLRAESTENTPVSTSGAMRSGRTIRTILGRMFTVRQDNPTGRGRSTPGFRGVALNDMMGPADGDEGEYRPG